jgi:3-hydroxyacyl-[acyl-carrier-protein] dehydratase
MIVLQNFYTELSSDFSPEKTSFISRIQLNAEHPVYAGHFAQMAVSPGVCLIQTIQEILEKKLGQTLFLKKGDNIKFLNMILPKELTTYDIHITFHKIENEFVVNAQYVWEGKVYLKCKTAFEIKN